MTRFALVIAGTMALLSAGCAVYGSAETATFNVQGDTGRVTADRWEGTVVCGPASGQAPCAAESIRERIR
ncbi:hypothetical protein [Microvirga sp. 2TAF3]|uniref:hypothetical protein n=1 Tax=Microvirga sp. 2TAF3 TaxID=3233014 RepID=UPI003F94DD97